MTRTFLFPTLLLLAGCGEPADRLTDEQAAAEQNAAIEETVDIDIPEPTTTAPPVSPAERYAALGTEPGWALTVTPETMRYEGDYGSVTISEATPPAFRPVPGRYAGSRLIVTIAPGPCSEGMSDRTYRHSVKVIADAKTVSGCGGGVIDDPNAPADPTSEATANAI